MIAEPLAEAEVEKAGEPWIADQGRLVSNYDAGSPGSSVGFIICQFQFFGSGSAWNCTALALLNPDPYRECGSGSGSRSQKIDQN
jgi:hypothetical protein